jgi:hypothetical protein
LYLTTYFQITVKIIKTFLFKKNTVVIHNFRVAAAAAAAAVAAAAATAAAITVD